MKLHLARRPDHANGLQDDDHSDGIGLSVLSHLDELRRRLIYSCIGVAIGTVIAFVFINQIVSFMFRPMRAVLPPGSKMIYTQPGEAFSVYVEIALIAGVILAAPWVMYQIW